MLSVHTPRSNVEVLVDAPSLFLGGTIDMGNSVDWQTEVINQLDYLHLNIYNPRCNGFPEFDTAEEMYQIKWELHHIRRVDYALMVFLDNSKSPISLLELGMFLKTHPTKTVVMCNENFYRHNNILLTCLDNGVRPVKTLSEAVTKVKQLIMKGEHAL